MSNWFIREPGPWAMEIHGKDGQMMVRLDEDGSLTFGENYEPDEAARIFWQAVTANMPPIRRSHG